MAFAKHTLILILVFAFFLLLTQCSNAHSSDDDSPSPAPAEEESESSPAPIEEEEEEEEESESSPTPSPPEDEEENGEDDEEDSSPSPTSTPTDSSEPAAESPLSINELFELSLPEIGVQKVGTGPLTDGAKVSNKQLEGIEHKIMEFKLVLAKREANPGSEESKKCLKQCQGNLDDAIDGVKKGIESINKQDLSKANVDISGVATDIETCNECFVEADGEDKEINAFNLWIKGVTKECLSNLKQ